VRLILVLPLLFLLSCGEEKHNGRNSSSNKAGTPGTGDADGDLPSDKPKPTGDPKPNPTLLNWDGTRLMGNAKFDIITKE
jgi:hypothetical protein